MLNWLTARAKATPNKVALIAGEYQWTFAEMQTCVDEMVQKLSHLGKQPIAVYMPNCPEMVFVLFALQRLGIISIPINTRLSASEIDQQVKNIGCQVFLYSSELMPPQAVLDSGDCDCYAVDMLIPQNVPTEQFNELSLDDTLTIIHTSGTSGTPKGAMLTNGNFYHSAMSSAYRLGVLPDDRWFCAIPLYHVGGLSILFRSVLYGTAVDLVDQFDVVKINHKLTHEPVTLVSLVPTMLHRLLEVKSKAWNPKFRLVLLGGAAATPELIQRGEEAHIPVATTYGLTEACSQVATAMPDLVKQKIGTVGKPLLFTEFRIVNESGDDVAQGEYGDVLVKSPTVMKGYFNQVEANQKILNGGWLHTGDIGKLDEEGDLWIVQRRSDLILSGGENVYPSEVEAVLRQHPSIKDVAVIGVDVEEWGQVVGAMIVLKDGQSLTTEEIQQFSRQHLAGYKIPRRVLFRETLPQTASGKVQRRKVVMIFNDEADHE